MFNSRITYIREYADRFELSNQADAEINSVERSEMTPSQVRMMHRIMNRFVEYSERCDGYELHTLYPNRRQMIRRDRYAVPKGQGI